MSKISEIIERWSTEGIKLPYAYDGVKKAPSITLLILHVASMCLFASLLYLHFDPKTVVATSMVMLWWALSYVFYLMRGISKAKFDLDDKSLELDSGEQKEAPEKE